MNKIALLFTVFLFCINLNLRGTPVPPGPQIVINSQVQGIAENQSFCTGTISNVTVEASMVAPIFFTGNPGPNTGVIVYDKGNDEGGWRYLQMASEDLFLGGDVFTGIGCNCSALTISNFVGGGKEATQAFVNAGCASSWLSNISGATISGFSDWYIPSLAEFDLVYNAFQGVNSTIFNPFQSGYYWTSTPASFGSCGINGGVFQKSMISGETIAASRTSGLGRVRLMRRFSNLPQVQWSTGETSSSIVLNHTTSGNFTLGLTLSGFNNSFTDTSIAYAGFVNWPQTVSSQLLFNYTVITPTVELNQEIFENDSLFFGGIWRNASGVYYDTIQSETGCLQVTQMNLVVLPIPLTCRIDVSYCAGDLQQLSLFADPPDSPGNPLSIQWSNGATTPQITLATNASGIYTVTVSDDVQTCTASVVIQNP